jgi:hypothetical protein
MAERAALSLVFGLVGLGTFSIRTKSFPNSSSASISWIFLWHVGSATIRTPVLSAPIPQRHSKSLPLDRGTWRKYPKMTTNRYVTATPMTRQVTMVLGSR